MKSPVTFEQNLVINRMMSIGQSNTSDIERLNHNVNFLSKRIDKETRSNRIFLTISVLWIYHLDESILDQYDIPTEILRIYRFLKLDKIDIDNSDATFYDYFYIKNILGDIDSFYIQFDYNMEVVKPLAIQSNESILTVESDEMTSSTSIEIEQKKPGKKSKKLDDLNKE